MTTLVIGLLFVILATPQPSLAQSVGPVKTGPLVGDSPSSPIPGRNDYPVREGSARSNGDSHPGDELPARLRGRTRQRAPFPLKLPNAPGGFQLGDEERYVRISADSTVNAEDDIVQFTGHVTALRKGLRLETNQIRYDRRTLQLEASGNVRVQDPLFSLTSDRLTLYTASDVGVAWESPRILQERKDAAGGVLERTEINAIQITFYTTEDRVEGLERVRIFRWVKRGRELALDFKIFADALDANLLTRRSVFKGGVRVESPTYNLTANRLIYDQTMGRFIAVGEARVEGFDAGGKVGNVVEGNKLIHFLDERRTIVSGSVAGVFEAESDGGSRPLNVENERIQEQERSLLPLRAMPGSGAETDQGSRGN